MNDLYSFISETVASLVITSKCVIKRSRSFTTVITKIIKFSINLGNSNKNFKTTQYSLERPFQKE